MAASSLGQGEIALVDVGRSSRQDDQITGEGQGEKAIAMEDVGQSSRQDDQITGEGAHENNAGDTGEGQGEIAIAMEDVGQSSRQDDQITGEGAHENTAGNTRMDPILYRYATMSKSGVIMRIRNFAGANGIPRQIELLVQMSENKVSTRGNTMLHLAANTGHMQLIQLITRYFPGLVRKRNLDEELPLHVAASAGHLSAVRKLVACMEGDTTQGNTLNEKDMRGNTALHVAVENNHQDVAMFLVGEDGSGSTLHSINNSLKTPLCMAAETANLELVKAMVNKTPNSSADAGNFWLGSKGSLILCSAIIWRKKAKGGLKKNDAESVFGMYILGYAIVPILLLEVGRMYSERIVSIWWLPRINRKNYTDLLETILSKMDSADLINSTDQEWMSPLMLAAYIGNSVAVRVLLHKETALAYEGDKNQFLPIHMASKKGHWRVVEEFLNHCPDLKESCDGEGRNILHVAAAHGRVDVVRYIIGKRDLRVLSKQRDQSGNTPLHIAVQNWHPKIVRILSLFHGYERANLNSLNNAGMTALDLAEKTEVDKKMFFRRKLTLMALNLANAPRSEEQTAAKAKLVKEDSVPKSLHNSDIVMFSNESVSTLLLVSTLVVGITFVQGFTIPGGYRSSGSDEGPPIFLTHWLFKIFLICNTVAMCGSITASLALLWAQTHDPNVISAAIRVTLPVLGVTFIMISSSFLAGVALMVYHVLWLRIFVCALGFFFTVFIVGLLAPLMTVSVSFVPGPIQAFLIFNFNILMFVSGYNFDDDWSNRWSL